MMSRPVFVSPTSASIIEMIRGSTTVFTIRQNGFDELLLECTNGPDEFFHLYREYTVDMASGVNREVQYADGWIMFTDEWDSESETDTDMPDLVTPVLETDYTVPMVEDVEECPVCYEPYEPMYGSVCGHHTCLDCMKRMDQAGLTKCPMCRSDDFKFPIAVACNKMFVTV